MTITLGRATSLSDPIGAPTVRGNLVSFSADIEGTSVDDCKAKMQQLSGMVDNADEDVFPFTWTEDSTFDGFYRVRSLTLSPVAVYLSTGLCPFTVELERVPTFATPVFESVVGSVLRTNSHSVVGGFGTNSRLTAWYSGGGYTVEMESTSSYTIASEDGNVDVYDDDIGTATTSILSYLKPADYYKAQAKIEVKYGSTWYPVVGNQIPQAVGINWRINNGLARLYPSADVGHGPFTVGNYVSSAWVEKELGVLIDSTTFTGATADSSDRALAVTVLRNSPERVTVRTKNGVVSYDWTIRRGDLHAELSISQPSAFGTSRQWGIGCTTSTSSTYLDGMMRKTTGTNRYLMSCTATMSGDSSSGKFYLTTAAKNAQFQVMADYYQGGGAGWADAALARNMFYGARLERQRIVPR